MDLGKIESAHHNLKRKLLVLLKILSIEITIIGRGKVTNSLNDEWFRIGINGFLNHTGNFNNKDCKNERWQEIKKKFELDLKLGEIIQIKTNCFSSSIARCFDVQHRPNKWALFVLEQ